MNIDQIPTGDNPPESLNVIIEVPIGGEPVKYEFDKASGALFVDRILHTRCAIRPISGFIPHTCLRMAIRSMRWSSPARPSFPAASCGFVRLPSFFSR